LTEFGVDSMRLGEEEQRQILSWQVRAAFAAGAAGTFVFAWTDEWFTGGHLIEDWAFGLVDRDREPKPAFHEVAARYKGPLPPALPRYSRVSVVVCSYNAERTMEACLASLEVLDYPDYEVIVVNDGSTDRTLEIAEGFRIAGSSASRTRGFPSLAMSAPRRRPARSSLIRTATASLTRIGSLISSARWRQAISPPAAAPTFRRPRMIWCRPRWLSRPAARPTF